MGNFRRLAGITAICIASCASLVSVSAIADTQTPAEMILEADKEKFERLTEDRNIAVDLSVFASQEYINAVTSNAYLSKQLNMGTLDEDINYNISLKKLTDTEKGLTSLAVTADMNDEAEYKLDTVLDMSNNELYLNVAGLTDGYAKITADISEYQTKELYNTWRNYVTDENVMQGYVKDTGGIGYKNDLISTSGNLITSANVYRLMLSTEDTAELLAAYTDDTVEDNLVILYYFDDKGDYIGKDLQFGNNTYREVEYKTADSFYIYYGISDDDAEVSVETNGTVSELDKLSGLANVTVKTAEDSIVLPVTYANVSYLDMKDGNFTGTATMTFEAVEAYMNKQRLAELEYYTENGYSFDSLAYLKEAVSFDDYKAIITGTEKDGVNTINAQFITDTNKAAEVIVTQKEISETDIIIPACKKAYASVSEFLNDIINTIFNYEA